MIELSYAIKLGGIGVGREVVGERWQVRPPVRISGPSQMTFVFPVFLGKSFCHLEERSGLEGEWGWADLRGKTMRVSGCSVPGESLQMERRALREGASPIVEVKPLTDAEAPVFDRHGGRLPGKGAGGPQRSARRPRHVCKETTPCVLQEVLCGVFCSWHCPIR